MKKIAKNTAALFVRQIVLALISLYTIRLLLQELGISDFGLLNATLSVVTLLSFVTGSLSMVIQRYLAFAIGAGSQSDARRYHDTCLFLTLASLVFIVLILETVGLWFVAGRMTVEPDRQTAVVLLYQLLILQFAISTITSFHSSVILAHEDMHAFALFSILGALLRLGAVFFLPFFTTDTLVTYGFLLVPSVVTVMIGQWIFCTRRYEESELRRLRVDFVTLREMLSFVRWTLFGQFTTVCRTQAVTLLINQAFNPATVAARALSFTVQTQVLTFTQNFAQALNPPITKAYAAGKSQQTFSLIMTGSKLAFFLSLIVTLPLIALLPGILNIWLGDYPEETVLFARLALVEGLLLSISFPLMAAVRAVGDVRAYELILGSLQVLVLLVSWVLVTREFPAYSVFVVAIVINIAMFGVRLWLTKKLLGLNVYAYTRSVMLPVGVVTIASVAITLALMTASPGASFFELSFQSLAAAGAITLSVPICVLFAGITRAEREALVRIVKSRFSALK